MKTDFIAAAGKICEQDVLVATRGYNFQRSLRKWFYMLGNALISLFLKAWVKIFRALQTMWRWLLRGVSLLCICLFWGVKELIYFTFFPFASFLGVYQTPTRCKLMYSWDNQHANNWGGKHFIPKSAGVGAVMATEKQKSSLHQAALPFKVVGTDMSL